MKLTNRGKFNLKRTPGFTLLEALVTVLLLSIGILGAAAMQATSVRNNHQSYLHSTATILADEIIDRIRANRGPLTNNVDAYDLATAERNPNCSNTTGCTPEQMARNDIWQWQQSLRDSFPSCGSTVCGIVCIDRSPYDGTPDNPQCTNDFAPGDRKTYAAKIWWIDPSQPDGDQLQFLVLTAQP